MLGLQSFEGFDVLDFNNSIQQNDDNVKSFDIKNSTNTSEIKREPVTDTTDENGIVFSKIQTKSPCILQGIGKCVLNFTTKSEQYQVHYINNSIFILAFIGF